MTYIRNDAMSAAYKRGQQAAFAHESREANPFERGSEQYRAWDLGWEMEAEEIARTTETDA